MSRLRTSWDIAKRSWAVLKAERSLAWFPVLSFLGNAAVAGVFGLLIYGVSGHGDSGSGSGSGFSLGAMSYVFIACWYVAAAFVTTYFMAALVAGADTALQGNDATVSGAMQVANSRLHRILPWALVTATVSILLRALASTGRLGEIVASLLARGWDVFTFLVVPILVVEDVGPGDAFKRSKQLFGKTWGENIAGQFGLSVVAFLAFLPALLVIGLGVASGTMLLAVPAIAVGVAWLLVVAAVVSALSGIYRTALYRYATTGAVPPAFEGADFQGAFKAKKSNGGFGGFSGFSRN
ncbi:MAG TPA: DUF6159 family protein [Acidimicrobiia bacterium]